MHYEDLSICTYDRHKTGPDSWSVPLYAVGWIESGSPFNQGHMEYEPKVKLLRMKEQSEKSCFFAGYRGTHHCSICGKDIYGSHKHLLVPGENCIYVASGGIVHYVYKHSYMPPEEFMNAIMSCPEVHSNEYRELLRSYHVDEVGLSFSLEEYREEFKRRILKKK